MKKNSSCGCAARIAVKGRAALAAVLLLLAAGAAPAAAGGDGTEGAGSMREEPASRPRLPRGPEADILIKFRGGTDEATRAAVCREAGLELIRAVAGPDLFLARVLAGQTRGQALKQLGARPEVVYAEPNIKRSLRGN